MVRISTNVVCRDWMKIRNSYLWLILPILITKIGISVVFSRCFWLIPCTARSVWPRRDFAAVRRWLTENSSVVWKKAFFLNEFHVFLNADEERKRCAFAKPDIFYSRCYSNDRRTLTGVQRCVVASASCSASCPPFQRFENICWVPRWHVLFSQNSLSLQKGSCLLSALKLNISE